MTKVKRRMGRPAGTARFTQKTEAGQVAAKGYRRLTFYTPEETAQRLKAAAALEGVPTSALLNRIIEGYLKEVRARI